MADDMEAIARQLAKMPTEARHAWLTERLADVRRERKRRDWSTLPVYRHKKFRCKKCQGDRFDLTSSRKLPDGTREQLRKCINCGLDFVLIIE